MVIKYKYSGLLLLEALFTSIPVFFFIWFFFGHKGVDAAHPFMLIIALSTIFHTVLFWLFKLFVACQKLWEKDYLSIKGDHICFYDCLRRKYTEVTADEIEGINDYHYYFVPFIVQIIYYCCPIKPLYAAISSLNPAEIGMISSNFKFQAPH